MSQETTPKLALFTDLLRPVSSCVYTFIKFWIFFLNNHKINKGNGAL